MLLDSTGKLQFTVTAFPTPETELTADWSTTVADDDTATADSDFTTARGMVSIAANTTTDTIEVDIVGDDTPEFPETFTVSLSNQSAGAKIYPDTSSAKGTINNDDGTGLSIETVNLDEGAAGETPNMVFTVTTVPPNSSGITYNWATSSENDDDAVAGTDYTASSAQNVPIAANATTDTFRVPLIGDDDPEQDETFTVTLSNATEATILVPTVKGTIANDDGSILSITDATLVEGVNGATSKMRFTVTATPLSASQLTATWTTSDEMDDTATENVDYTKATDTITIAANTPSATFDIDILDDTTPEFPETFTVTLSNPSTGAQISKTNGSAKGTIGNDDGTGLQIETVSMDEGADTETPNLTFTITTVPPSSSAITFDWDTSIEAGDTATADTDYTTTTGRGVTIVANAPTHTIDVPIIGDDDPEADETFTVTLSNVASSEFRQHYVISTFSTRHDYQ